MLIFCNPFSIFALIASYLYLLPFTFCSHLHDLNHFGTHNITNNQIHKVSSVKISDIAIHGLLLWASMGLLMPLGILIVRMSSREEPSSRRNRLLFYLHVVFQMIAVLLATVGPALSLKKFENSFDNSHQRLGLALYAAILIQAFLGFFRPHREKKERSYWYILHWMVGTIVSLVGIINIYTGLRAYHKRTLKSTRLWTILFTAQVTLIAVVFLLQDKLDYMKKQSLIILPTTTTHHHHHSSSILSSNPHNNIPQTDLITHKDLVPVSPGKSNALANLFD